MKFKILGKFCRWLDDSYRLSHRARTPGVAHPGLSFLSPLVFEAYQKGMGMPVVHVFDGIQ